MATQRSEHRLALRPPLWLVVADGAGSMALAVVLMSQRAGDNLLTALALLGVYWLLQATLHVVDLLAHGQRRAWKALGAATCLAAALVPLRQPLWSTLLVPALLARPMGGFALAAGAVNLLRALAGGGARMSVLAAQSLLLGVLLLQAPPEAIGWGATALAGAGGVAALALAARLRFVEAVAQVRQARDLAG